MPGYYSGINILGAGVEVTKVTLCASFCWKSLSRPSFCNLDSTPPQVSNATANDGDPCAGRHSQTSQDVIPSHPGLFEKPSFPGPGHDSTFFWEPVRLFFLTQLKYDSVTLFATSSFSLSQLGTEPRSTEVLHNREGLTLIGNRRAVRRMC